MENLDSGVAIPNVISNPVSMGSAVNTKLVVLILNKILIQIMKILIIT